MMLASFPTFFDPFHVYSLQESKIIPHLQVYPDKIQTQSLYQIRAVNQKQQRRRSGDQIGGADNNDDKGGIH